MKYIIAVGGSPGTGKTTLFREFMKGKTWKKVEPMKLLPALYCEEIDTYILGKYDEGETFAGTDRLSMAVQPVAQKFLTQTKSNILFEGDRIFNQSFLEHATLSANHDLEIVYLKTSKEILEQRYKDRGSDQSEVFLKGRETKYNNILSNMELMPYINEFENSTLEQQAEVLEFISSKLG